MQRDYEANVQQAIGEAVMEYCEQLAVAKKDQQLKDREHQRAVHKLRDRLCPGIVVGRPGNSAFSEAYPGRGRFAEGGVRLPSRYCQHKKGRSRVRYPGSGFIL